MILLNRIHLNIKPYNVRKTLIKKTIPVNTDLLPRQDENVSDEDLIFGDKRHDSFESNTFEHQAIQCPQNFDKKNNPCKY
jgi:hypothetical protein